MSISYFVYLKQKAKEERYQEKVHDFVGYKTTYPWK